MKTLINWIILQGQRKLSIKGNAGAVNTGKLGEVGGLRAGAKPTWQCVRLSQKESLMVLSSRPLLARRGFEVGL